jgi:hypothetical protein
MTLFYPLPQHKDNIAMSASVKACFNLLSGLALAMPITEGL